MQRNNVLKCISPAGFKASKKNSIIPAALVHLPCFCPSIVSFIFSVTAFWANVGKELVERGGTLGPDLNTVAVARELVVPRVTAESRWPRLCPAVRLFSLDMPARELFCGVLTQQRELTSCSLAGISSRWIIVLCASTNKEVDLKSYQLMFPRGPTPRSLR